MTNPASHHTIDLLALSDEALKAKLAELSIVLTPDEARSIQRDMLQRPPTLCELILFSIQGSEHSSYKSSRVHLRELVTQSERVCIGAEEDAGVIRVAQDQQGHHWCVVMSHESHNHPSQIVPFEGAATGVGGNVRDVLCMGAEVIASANGLRFGSFEQAKTQWLLDGVVDGIGGYGNPIGVPTVAGDLYFDPGYETNCLVTLVTLGIVKEEHIIHSKAPKHGAGFDLILVGKPTDESGFGGASFSSIDLDEQQNDQNRGAVQEPNAFLKQHLIQATLELFSQLQKSGRIADVGFKDLGAGGIACASVELADAAGLGAEIDLTHVPVAHDALNPAVILCSETQERFMWVSPPELTSMILHHYNQKWELPSIAYNSRAAVIGRIADHHRYLVRDAEHIYVDATTEQITRGFRYHRPWTLHSAWPQKLIQAHPERTTEHALLELLANPNACSRKPILDQYDKQVQGRTWLEPNEADAAVLTPFNNHDYPEEIREVGIALAVDHNPRYCQEDAYLGTMRAVAEAATNVVCTGALPIAISDCLCAGNPLEPEQMGEFVAMVRGIVDICALFTEQWTPLPVIAGNVSLNNYSGNRAIPPSPMIGCLGRITEVKKSRGLALKKPHNHLLRLGGFEADLRCSLYAQHFGLNGSGTPSVLWSKWIQCLKLVHDLLNEQRVLACHDLSDGGLALALAEMAIAAKLGIELDAPTCDNLTAWWFAEHPAVIIEIQPDQLQPIRQRCNALSVPCQKLGTVTERFTFSGALHLDLNQALERWQQGLNA